VRTPVLEQGPQNIYDIAQFRYNGLLKAQAMSTSGGQRTGTGIARALALATVASRAWLPARRNASLHPREVSQPAAARTRRTFSSAPQVRARATASGAGLVLRAIACAIAMSASVGRTVIGTVSLGWRRAGLARILAVVRMVNDRKR
jgi:hypothetical protein